MNISIRLPETTVEKVELLSARHHITRVQYIREAIEYYNKLKYDELLRERMTEASLKVRQENMTINKEFQEIEGDV